MGALRDDLSQVVHVPIPAAGAGFKFTPSLAEYSRVRLVAFSYTSSATVATRQVSLSLLDGAGAVVATIPSPASQTAGQTDEYTFGLGLYPFSVNAASAAVAPLPDMWIRPGGSIQVTVASIDAADTITKIRVVLDQVSFLQDRGDEG